MGRCWFRGSISALLSWFFLFSPFLFLPIVAKLVCATGCGSCEESSVCVWSCLNSLCIALSRGVQQPPVWWRSAQVLHLTHALHPPEFLLVSHYSLLTSCICSSCSYSFSLKPIFLFHIMLSNPAPLPDSLSPHKPLVSKTSVISPNYIRVYIHTSLAYIWMSYFEHPSSTFHQAALILMFK